MSGCWMGEDHTNALHHLAILGVAGQRLLATHRLVQYPSCSRKQFPWVRCAIWVRECFLKTLFLAAICHLFFSACFLMTTSLWGVRFVPWVTIMQLVEGGIEEIAFDVNNSMVNPRQGSIKALCGGVSPPNTIQTPAYRFFFSNIFSSEFPKRNPRSVGRKKIDLGRSRGWREGNWLSRNTPHMVWFSPGTNPGLGVFLPVRISQPCFMAVLCLYI